MTSTDSEHLVLSLSTGHTYRSAPDSAALKEFKLSVSMTEFLICSTPLPPCPRQAHTLSFPRCSFFPLSAHLGVHLNTSFSLHLGHYVLLDLPPENLKSIYLHSHCPGLIHCTFNSYHFLSPSYHVF